MRRMQAPQGLRTLAGYARRVRALVPTRSCGLVAGPALSQRRLYAAQAASDVLEKTACSDLHRALGGKMVAFAGYELPLLYEGHRGGIVKETLHTRATAKAGLFDVSHLGQIKWTGEDAAAFLEKILVSDIKGLKEGQAQLSLITTKDGGIIDDAVVTNAGDYIYLVVNGARKHVDMAHFNEQRAQFAGDVHMEYLERHQLLALQGKGAAAVLQPLLEGLDLSKMKFMTGVDTRVAGVEGCRLTRGGYTGEDGFEVSVPYEHAIGLAEKLLSNQAVLPAGLGSRDVLRLEAGLCLYGNDIDTSTNPVEAALAWTLGDSSSRRRTEQGFLGASTFLHKDGKPKKHVRERVGIIGMKAPARRHTQLYDESGKDVIGEITSGTFSPCLQAPIAMGYVATTHAKAGTHITVDIRGRKQPAKVVSMPFLDTSHIYESGLKV